MGVREFARLRVAPELLAELPHLLPRTVRIVGSAQSPEAGVVCLVLDVTDTGQQGGDWTCIVADDGAERIVRLGRA